MEEDTYYVIMLDPKFTVYEEGDQHGWSKEKAESIASELVRRGHSTTNIVIAKVITWGVEQMMIVKIDD